MIKFISLDTSKFSSELIKDEVVSLTSVFVGENGRMTQMSDLRGHHRNKKKIPDLLLSADINVFT